jgi:hypothetical protein
MHTVLQLDREEKGRVAHELWTTGRGHCVVVGDPLPAEPDGGFFRGAEAEVFGHGKGAEQGRCSRNCGKNARLPHAFWNSKLAQRWRATS